MFNFLKRKQQSPSYIMTNDGNITIRWNGRTHAVGKTHRNYDQIVAALLNKENADLDNLLDVGAAIERAVKGVTVNEYGEVFYGGEQMHGVIADKISEFVRQKLPYKPLMLFLSNLMENPSERSRQELYGFLTHTGFPITHDGCFMAYKGITSDWKDMHTRSFDNSIGSVNEMPREQVDPNAEQLCSVGFHVGTHAYASDFASNGGVVVMVKVNPRDAVSVPVDHDASKLRVCRYEVVEICQRLIEEPLYTAPGEVVEDYQDDPAYDPEDEEDSCDESFQAEYSEGYSAGMAGCSEYGNPYEDETDEFDFWQSGWESGDGERTYDPTTPDLQVKTPKRAACSYCGSKGGKKHDRKCKRPQK